MCHKFTRFKIIIKNEVGGHLAWALACGASEKRKLLTQERIVVVVDKGTVFFFSSPALRSCHKINE